MARGPTIPLAKPPKDAVEIFQRTPPWWARWVLALVAVDTMVTTSMMELTWFHWGTMEPKAKTSGEISNGDAEELEFVPRPYSLRSVACFMHFATGCGIAGALLATRSRIVRSIHLLHPLRRKGEPRHPRIYVSTASMPFGKGASWPMHSAALVADSHKLNMQLQTSSHGRWLIDPRGATVEGKPVPKDPIEAQRRFCEVWNRHGCISQSPNTGRKTRK
ncbi:hypothetical protein CVT24_002670 [Panaeolus cyanescens]|uniref:Uncharacterized protein n=1 Tax=Panaeolus cyanescens TaxID=181874 RepID=A0A409X1Z3_9AGAR|nr:hypothetical protein CVT24_002670 [Panaeolus cyanescens]